MSELSLTELTGALRDPIFADVPGLNGVSLSAQVIPTGDGVDVIAIRPHLHHSPDLPAPLLSARADLPWTPGGHPAGLISREALLALSPEELLTMETSAARAFLHQDAPPTRGARLPLPLTAITAGVTLLGLGLTGALLINPYLLFGVSVALIIGGLLSLTADMPLTHMPAGQLDSHALMPAGPGRYHVSHWTRMIPTIPEITGALRGPVAPGVTLLGVSLPTQVDATSGTVQVQPTLHFTDQVLSSVRTARVTPHVLHALRHDRAELARISRDAPDRAAPVLPVEAFSGNAVQQAARQALLERVKSAGQAGPLCMRTLPLSVGPILLTLLHEPLNLHLPTLWPLCLGMLGVNAALLAVIIATHWTDLRVAFHAGPSPRLRPDQFEPGRFSYLRPAVTPISAAPPAAPALPERSGDLREQVAAQGAARSLSTLRDVQRRAQVLKAAHADDAALTARLDQLIERTQVEIATRHEDARKRSGQQELEDLEQAMQTELHYLGSLRR